MDNSSANLSNLTNMKNKLKTFVYVVLATIFAMLLFVIVIGCGNYLQALSYKSFGNIVMSLFPVVIFFYMFILNKKYNNLQLAAYGFTLSRFWRNLLIGLILPIVIISFSLLIAKLFMNIEIVYLPAAEDFVLSLLIVIWTYSIVGIWEEFFFRGFVFITFVKGNYGFHISALLSSILFSVMHWSSFDMDQTSLSWYVGIVVIGYLITVIYVITKSIVSVIVFHLCWNVCAHMLDGENNGLGLINITNYAKYSKSIDDLMVGCLTFCLLIFLLLFKTKLRSQFQAKANYSFPDTSKNIVLLA